MRDAEGRDRERSVSSERLEQPFDGGFGEASIRFEIERDDSIEGVISVLVDPPAGVDIGGLDARVALVRNGKVVNAFGREHAGQRVFEFMCEEEGEYQVFATANGLRTGPISCGAIMGQRIEVTLSGWESASGIGGVALDRSGNPVPGAIVRLRQRVQNPAHVRWDLYVARTDDEGRFVMPSVVQIDELEVQAFAGGVASSRSAVQSAEGSLNLRLVIPIE